VPLIDPDPLEDPMLPLSPPLPVIALPSSPHPASSAIPTTTNTAPRPTTLLCARIPRLPKLERRAAKQQDECLRPIVPARVFAWAGLGLTVTSWPDVRYEVDSRHAQYAARRGLAGAGIGIAQ
jgi:hypothetical protein